jgi:hypothetical protein
MRTVHESRPHSRRWAAALLITAWLAPPPGASADVSAQSAIQEQLVKIRNQLQNARSRMANGIVGLSRDKQQLTPATPAEACCSINLAKIGSAVLELQAILDRLDTCYAEKNQDDARTARQFARNDLDLFVDAVRQWSKTRERNVAEAQLATMVRPYNQMRDGLRALPECPADRSASSHETKDDKSAD